MTAKARAGIPVPKFSTIFFRLIFPMLVWEHWFSFPFPIPNSLKTVFKASALWTGAFYKSICPSVCVSVCPSVCPCVHFRGTV